MSGLVTYFDLQYLGYMRGSGYTNHQSPRPTTVWEWIPSNKFPEPYVIVEDSLLGQSPVSSPHRATMTPIVKAIMDPTLCYSPYGFPLFKTWILDPHRLVVACRLPCTLMKGLWRLGLYLDWILARDDLKQLHLPRPLQP